MPTHFRFKVPANIYAYLAKQKIPTFILLTKDYQGSSTVGGSEG